MDRELLHNRIVRQIIQRINTGEYSDKGRLPGERTLSEEFNVSRGTIRDALANLEKIGIVKIRPGAGAYVRKFTSSDIPDRYLPPNFESVNLADIVLARKAIECAAVETLCEKITPKGIMSLREIVSRMAAGENSMPDFIKCDIKFHQTLIELSQNRVLQAAFEAIYEYHRYSQIFSGQTIEELENTVRAHQQIVNAITERNPQKAAKLLSRHLEQMVNH